ncbi:hypothetical protein [Agrobacterium tumefaciens]|uniref:DUF2158 domain-containing protein n=1 Tax=Agrobacterium tumefaciens TaxID=358 RepID=A0AA44JB21_AGRTU|nr:hypothetical protein [Agrobacterium tumefaciens]NTB86376.1 hypothetical protein [Agrobacterium tumefaciens]NTC17392.1 hypothetical protein [Agrobacterium tumefaciens]NTC30253.1 hypothetical protein [Agrobacterium tumefaciens]
MSAGASFKAGDKVVHASSNQIMVFLKADGEDAVCEWFDGKKNNRDKFALAALTTPPQRAAVGFRVSGRR